MKNKIEKIKRLLPEIENSIREALGDKVKRIILYGSYARGDYDEDSDIDIMVIVDDEDLSYYKEQRNKVATEYLDKENILLSIVIQKESITEKYKDYSPFLKNVLN